MNLVFIYGLPGVGKLTVAKELSKITGYKLFHNHLTVDLVESVFDFGTPSFVEAREEIWFMMFQSASKWKLPGMVFTFAPEKTVQPNFIQKLERMIKENGDSLYFIELTCEKEELKKRIGDASRQKYGKLTNADKLDVWLEDGTLQQPKIEDAMQIDTTNLSPEATAQKIKDNFNLD